MTTKLNQLPLALPHAAGGVDFKILRTIKRAFWVTLCIARAFLEFFLFVGINPKKAHASRRAWLKRTARGLLEAMEVSISVEGRIPDQGLLVCNHLGYLDILVLASLVPATFVSKQEVAAWPVFGKLAQCAGTIFIRRQSRADVAKVAGRIDQLLGCGGVVVLFPEGTSSNGSAVLPFRSSLLAPVLQHQHPVSAAALDYELTDGSVEKEVCYWGDMVLAPHLLNILSKQGIHATVRFGAPIRQTFNDRKQLAEVLHAKVCSLKSGVPNDS
jgi:1-acyl-sn-glycerol-3-phosphate acyltransferase